MQPSRQPKCASHPMPWLMPSPSAPTSRKSVCGKPDGDCCPFHPTCAYQRQKAAVAAADVVIAAHNIMFHEIPKIVTKNLALTITDESWWQIGLESERETKLAELRGETCSGIPVLRDPDAVRGIDGRKKRRPKGRRAGRWPMKPPHPALHELAVKSAARIRGDGARGRVGQPGCSGTARA